ncbi:MAG: IS1634 family transposase [Peptococcaceae bacterium]|jgi:transposase|nr:IS1634 family transposase [Peptococcaceae bacterium]
MFVKSSWTVYKGKRFQQYHVAESYRDDETGVPRHRLLMNLTPLPPHVIESIRESLKTGKALGPPPQISVGDTLRGAGLLAIHRAWQTFGMSEVLDGLTKCQQDSVEAMVIQRILHPGSKRSLKAQLRDTVFGRFWSAKRMDEDELYEIMDILSKQFYSLQERLRQRHSQKPAPVLCLYDTTSTYFEGTKAEDGEYGYSRDKRWDRYQIVIGLVCDEEGIPMAIEIWPGNESDRTTVVDRITILRKRFGIEKAVFIGDRGMYSDINIAALEEAGFDYILGLEWRREREQLEKQAPLQLELFDKIGVVGWEDNNMRYVGCASEPRRQRAVALREAGMKRAEEDLAQLARTAASRRIYSWTRLREKCNQIVHAAKVADLWQVNITPLEDMPDPETKMKLNLQHAVDAKSLEIRKAIEGKYVLQTSLAASHYPAEKVDRSYRELQKVERAWRHIKSFLKIRPVFHHIRRRVRAHVLICFLAYYLVKNMELEMRRFGETREAETVLRDCDRLRLVELTLKAGDNTHTDWQWSLGVDGSEIREKLKTMGWWPAIDQAARNLVKSTLTDNGKPGSKDGEKKSSA